MKFENVVIESFAYHLPENSLTSSEIESKLSPIYERLKLPAGRLELMTGIRSRRLWERGVRPSAISAEAAKKALSIAGIKGQDIDVLIHASVCRDFLEPATASVVHNLIEASDRCMIFDLSNACLGVINSFVTLANMIELGTIKRGLVVAGENGGPLLEDTIKFLNEDQSLTRKSVKKYVANLTIGAAAVAYVISHKDLAPSAPKILGHSLMTDSSANTLCQGDGNTNSLMMQTDSEELMKSGVRLAKSTWKMLEEELNWNTTTPNWVIGHQVGTMHEDAVLKALKLKNIPTYRTYPEYGNTGSSALPLTLCKLSEERELKRGDKIALLGIGSGLSSIMMGVEW